jgi:hypothetical protein
MVSKGANDTHLLKPSTLPAMVEEVRQIGKVRFISTALNDRTSEIRIEEKDDLRQEHGPWSRLLAGAGSVTIAPNSRRRVIVDLDNYYCAYPFLVTSEGNGSVVRIYWDESLYLLPDPNSNRKGNRDEVYGKYFSGVGDLFKPDGGEKRLFETLWWEAGRYVEIYVETADRPLIIERLGIRETRYPVEIESTFTSDDVRLEEIIPVAVRGLQMCSHETYMDCPFYEQLQYIGDTRLEVLTTYAITRDDRLPRKALAMFDAGRRVDGLTNCAYPGGPQLIAPFSLWWVAMLHDYAFWRGDLEFIRHLMPGARGVIDRYVDHIGDDDLVRGLRSWNFMDWINDPSWNCGVPPDGQYGVNSMINWHFVLVLTQMAQLEVAVGEPELAQRCLRIAKTLAGRCKEVFWDENRGMYAETAEKKLFSEHTQCLALLSGIPDKNDTDRLAAGLVTAPDLFRATIYFSHYLLEALGKIDKMERFFQRLEQWFDLKKYGMKTTYESYLEDGRSDCHAWGAHPLFHFFATILGIRPASPGFSTVRVTPHLGHLKHAAGTLVHPKGEIQAEYFVKNGQLTGSIVLPQGVSGEFLYGDKRIELKSGSQQI